MITANYLKIGEVAKQTGVSVGTLRYYESLKLLSPAQRGDNNYRYYSLSTVEQVKFIKQAQALGLSLEEIGQILAVRSRGEIPCPLVQDLLQRKIAQLDEQIVQMTTLKLELETYRDRWSKMVNVNHLDQICPLIATVS